VVVPAVTHGIWNSAVYVLFNFGAETGELGIHNTSTFGPEAGWLALVLNLGYAAGLWLWYRHTESMRAVPEAGRTGRGRGHHRAGPDPIGGRLLAREVDDPPRAPKRE
jgi:hypothetical protein